MIMFHVNGSKFSPRARRQVSGAARRGAKTPSGASERRFRSAGRRAAPHPDQWRSAGPLGPARRVTPIFRGSTNDKTHELKRLFAHTIASDGERMSKRYLMSHQTSGRTDGLEGEI